MQSKPNPRSRRRATTQTIEQIEAQAEAIRQAEADVMADLAAWLRAAAVELPVESKLPVKMAQAAKGADVFTNGPDPQEGFWRTEKLIDEWGEERCEELLARLARTLGRTVS